jgi:hypothetical protein
LKHDGIDAEIVERGIHMECAAPLPSDAFWEHVPTVDDVGRIAALTDPMLRNLQITQCYCELSQALTLMTGVTANWCTFATWASKQAGQTIRQEDLARTFERLLGQSPGASEAINKVVMVVGAAALAAECRHDPR